MLVPSAPKPQEKHDAARPKMDRDAEAHDLSELLDLVCMLSYSGCLLAFHFVVHLNLWPYLSRQLFANYFVKSIFSKISLLS